MKKLVLFFVLVFGVSFLYVGRADAQKIIRKTVKKIVKPEIAPTPPPTVSTGEAIPTPPPPPPTEVKYSEKIGLFGWGINTDLGAMYLYNRANQTGLFGVLGFRGNIIFDDPISLGSRISLAEDAFQLKLGLGVAFGNDLNNNPINSVPILADVIVYLWEGSFFGLDPYVGGGINYNLSGTGQVSGGSGSQIYGGVLVGTGSEAGKTGIEIGYDTIRVGTALITQGISVSVVQPFIL